MKKLLLMVFLSVLPAIALSVSDVASNFTKFVDIVQKQKNGWISYKQDFTNAEFDLIKKHHTQMFDMKKKHIQQYQQGGDMNKFMQAGLKDKLALHKQQMEDWKNLSEQYQKKAQDMSIKYKQEIADFETSLAKSGPEKESTAAPEQEEMY